MIKIDQGVLGLVRSMGRELPSFKKYDLIPEIFAFKFNVICFQIVIISSISIILILSNIMVIDISSSWLNANLIVREKVRMVGISPLFVNTELVRRHIHQNFYIYQNFFVRSFYSSESLYLSEFFIHQSRNIYQNHTKDVIFIRLIRIISE